MSYGMFFRVQGGGEITQGEAYSNYIVYIGHTTMTAGGVTSLFTLLLLFRISHTDTNIVTVIQLECFNWYPW